MGTKFQEGQMVCCYSTTGDDIIPYAFLVGHISLIEGNRIHVIWYDVDKWRHPSGWSPIQSLFVGDERDILGRNMPEAKEAFNKRLNKSLKKGQRS